MSRLSSLLLILYLFLCTPVFGQVKSTSRILISQDRGWQFARDTSQYPGANNVKQSNWETISLPHTWNIDDIMDDTPGYYQGVSYYRKRITIPASMTGRKIFLCFDGANQETTVFINGKKAGLHKGGYTRFNVYLSPYLKSTDRFVDVLVKVDNSIDPDIPPLSADFTFYGGIYRSVHLLGVNPVHFGLDTTATQQVMISTPVVNEQQASVTIKGLLVNEQPGTRKLKTYTIISDKKGKVIAHGNSILNSRGNDSLPFSITIDDISKPRLWSPDDPYLYNAETSIVDAATGKVLDLVVNRIGFRWFHFDAAKGFSLNGKPLQLIGTSRHQDYKGLGNAVNKQLARKDIELIKAMGSNFFRVAHYPQDPYLMDVCDEIGLLTSVEIPLVNEITESAAFYANCLRMQTEMIRQNYNHPSVIIWCYMNEIFLRPHYENDKERQMVYFSAVEKLARSLDSLTRKEDPSRYTMIANHADFSRYNEYHLTTIAQITGWNLYAGWYGGKQEDFPAFLDRHHAQLPDQPFMITEYGADADPRIRSMQPVRFDKSVEYATAFHQYYLAEIRKRPFVAGAVVWNLADFNSETRTETMPHINNKGLLTWDRIPKDAYYLYQAGLLKDPYLRITSSAWKYRSGIADSAGLFCIQPVQVATNLPEVDIYLNGRFFRKVLTVNGLAEVRLPFVQGKNQVMVKGEKNGLSYNDKLDIQFKLVPQQLSDRHIPFTSVSLLLGANRLFIEEENSNCWMPAKAYSTGGWGYIGGYPFLIRDKGRLPYGTDKNILGTMNDPIYQTQLEGIRAFRFDVPDGNYEMKLHFAELKGGFVPVPPYNLSESARDEIAVPRVFDVTVNGMPWIERLNLRKEYGPDKAVIKTRTISVKNGSGIQVDFTPIEGETVLNAIQLTKLPK